MDAFSLVSSAAHDGSFGKNSLPEPSLASLRAGNYKKGRVTLHGLRIAIETPQGHRRTGKANGEPWSVICQAHYGYIEGTRGADGDELDVFIGPWPESERVWVVNRTKGDDSGFDEHKLLLGFVDAESAITAYRNSYERGQAGDTGVMPAVVACSIDQLKWWIEFGNHAVPLTANQLPYDGTATMNEVIWDSTANPVGVSIHELLYAMRRNDSGEGLLLDSVSVADVLEDSDGEAVLDALVVPLNRLERKLGQMQVIMRAAGKEVKPVAMQIAPPFKQRGTTNVACIFEMSDGQTVSIYFHNPDATPNRLTPDDEMVSWKWMLNKKDVTIVVARERGQELNPREVARRVMRLVDANSSRFKAANERRSERMANIEQAKAGIEAKQAQLDTLNAEIDRLEPLVEAKRNAPPAVLQKDDKTDGDGEIPVGATETSAVAETALQAFRRLEKVAEAFGAGKPQFYGVIQSDGEDLAEDFMPERDNKQMAMAMGEIAKEHGYAFAFQINVSRAVAPYRCIQVLYEDGRGIGSQFAATPKEAFDMLPAQTALPNEPDWKSVDPTTEAGYDAVLAAGEEALLWHQDKLDSFFGGRLVAIRNALRELGWADDGSRPMQSGPLKKGKYVLEPLFKHVGPGRNVVGISYRITGVPGFYAGDILSMTPAEMAARIDKAVPDDAFQPEPDDYEKFAERARIMGRSLEHEGFRMKDGVYSNGYATISYILTTRDTGIPPSLEYTIKAPHIPTWESVKDDLSRSQQSTFMRVVELAAKPEDEGPTMIEHLVELVREAKGGVAKAATSSYFTFDFNGESDILFTDELRAQVEAALGEKVKAVVLTGLEGQESIVPESFAAPEPAAPSPPASDPVRAAVAAQWKGLIPAESGGYIVGSVKRSGSLIVAVDGKLDRATYKAIVSEAKQLGLSPDKMIVYCDLAPYTGAGIDVMLYADAKLNLAASDPAADPLADARTYLQSVIDGTIDLSAPDVADKLTDLYNAHNGNAEFDDLFAKAADAYQAHMVALAQKALQ